MMSTESMDNHNASADSFCALNRHSQQRRRRRWWSLLRALNNDNWRLCCYCISADAAPTAQLSVVVPSLCRRAKPHHSLPDQTPGNSPPSQSMRRFAAEWSLRRREMPTSHRQRTSVDKPGIDIPCRCGWASAVVQCASPWGWWWDATPSSACRRRIFTTKSDCGLACEEQRCVDKLYVRCDVDIRKLDGRDTAMI